MEENMVNNNNGTEEVPLDLFNQVSLDEFEPVEIVDLEEKPKEEPSNTVISIPADAYFTSSCWVPLPFFISRIFARAPIVYFSYSLPCIIISKI